MLNQIAWVRRWVVERAFAFAWFYLNQRLAKDFEPAVADHRIHTDIHMMHRKGIKSQQIVSHLALRADHNATGTLRIALYPGIKFDIRVKCAS